MKRSEDALIARFLAAFGRASARGVVLGPGDDAAALRPARGKLLVATTDAVVEGVHFDRRYFSAEDVGWKALAVNLSDLAAMGAAPRWFLCAVACRRDEDPRWLGGVARGMGACARAHGGALVGGNFSAAKQASFTITALGEVRPRRVLLRAGARPGDLLFLVGDVGLAAAGLARLRAGARAHPSARAQLRPVPRGREGRVAARFARAAIDVSDGLVRDLGRVCTASRCGAVVELALLDEPWDLACAGGEDYALVLAVPRARAAAFARALPSARRIGAFVRGRGVRCVAPDGRRWTPPEGWDPFSGASSPARASR